MNNITHDDEGTVAAQARRYPIEVAEGNLEFKKLTINDPVPLGRQILAAAGANPVEDYSLLAVLPGGDFEDVRLDEQFDVRGRGIERFVMFATDRVYKFAIDQHQMEWGKPVVSGKVLRALAKLPPGYALYQEVRGGQDIEILDTDLIDLSKPGIERFISVIKETTEGLSALPSMDREYLAAHAIEHTLTSWSGHSGVVLHKLAIPAAKFGLTQADFLILLPAGYPDVPPDMFYAFPWLKLSDTGTWPRAADQAFDFDGRRWQRWSRHSQAWRPGVDGLHTMIARVHNALEVAR
ncbi:multiubiquitin domain-containing protein [Panacagrimonas sp.]|uniref:multiubiquitin domain-containing protein n=1 Tax=Panacagrimonas sp. TaxID=2480088 RepID=UPI003B5270B1